MGRRRSSFLLETNENIIESLNQNPKAINLLDSFDIYQIVLLSQHNKNFKKFLIANKNIILDKICRNYHFFDGLSILILMRDDYYNGDAKKIYNESMKKIFNPKTLLFMNHINNENLDTHCYNKQQILSHVFSELSQFDSLKASIILYNLNEFNDFRIELKNRFRIVEILLSAYQKFDTEVMANNSYKGSTILGCLLKDDNQYLVQDYIDDLISDSINGKVECIGAGSTCLVFKIGNKVLKLGETRNSRKIYVNHRILASQVRKLLTKGEEELFYVEVMKYLKNIKVTQEECDELQEDLLRQGLIWEDAKIENCGLLNDGDENISYLPVDYEEVVGEVDNPVAREEFMKRKRKVIVLDNDNIRPDPKLNWR